jgi:DNA-binding transcriptional MerR regulator
MKIAEVSEKFGFTPDTLRYYERIGLIPPVPRNGGGIREYTEVDIKRIEFIRCLRNAGLPIETLIEYFSLLEQGDRTVNARKELLVEQREILKARIAEMQKTLELLNYKIEFYDNKIMEIEKEIKH